MQDLEVNYTGNRVSIESKKLIENIHYSKTARSQLPIHVFILKKEGTQVGVAIFGMPICRHYDRDTLELRRFVLTDAMPKNTESFFLGNCLRWIEKNDREIVRVITYADPNQGHTGTIYKATNFMEDGEELSGNPRIVKMGDKVIHIRQLYQKRNGEYAPDAKKYQAAVKSGLAKIVKQKKKLKFTYWFRK
jgi:hypothetical protein